MRHRLPFLAALGLFAASALGAIAPNDARAEYERLQKWQFSWSYDVKPDGEAFLLTIHLERRDVSDGFTTVIPVKVEMADGKSGFLFLTSREAKESITRKVPVKPKNVIFAPESSLLANIKRN